MISCVVVFDGREIKVVYDDTRPVTMRAKHPLENFSPPWKNVSHII